MQRALFITHKSHIGTAPGGVQTCTREFIHTLEAAQIDLEVVEITHDMSPLTRLARQVNSSPFLRPIGASSLSEIAQRIQKSDARLVFFNQVALSGAIAHLRALEQHRTIKIALSHGCEITDLLHLVRLKDTLPLSSRLRPTARLALTNVLSDEVRARRELDGVVSISAYDAQTEGWLGSRQATWLPRLVNLAALDWRPHGDRFGFVGTLDHAPNLEGLEAILVKIANLKSEAIRIRIVGGPDRIGQWLASRFPFVDYLGALDDADLKAEASTWRAFLNPIFCQARGCSTKVATALSWGIPVVTTEYGRRGYVWSDGGVIEADTPAAFVRQMLDLLSEAGARRAHERVVAAAANSPSLTDVAGKLRNFIDTVEASIRGAASA